MRQLFGESIRWVFFDLGNTLIDESASIARRVELIAAAGPEFGYLELRSEEIYRQIEVASADHAVWPLRTALSALGVRDTDIQRLSDRCRYDHTLERLFPHAIPLLEQTSTHYKLGYVANQSPGLTERMTKLGIGRHFQTGSDSGASAFSKPDPRLYEEALERAGTVPSVSVMVGDRVDNDVAPAKRLGMKTVRIRQGYSRLQEPRGPDETADWTVSSLSELLK